MTFLGKLATGFFVVWTLGACLLFLVGAHIASDPTEDSRVPWEAFALVAAGLFTGTVIMLLGIDLERQVVALGGLVFHAAIVVWVDVHGWTRSEMPPQLPLQLFALACGAFAAWSLTMRPQLVDAARR